MNIFRGPQGTPDDDRKPTYKGMLAKLLLDRSPLGVFWVNGTKKKEPKRVSAIGLQFNVEDVSALVGSLLEYQKKRIEDLSGANLRLQREVSALKAELREANKANPKV